MVSVKCHPLVLQTQCKICHEHSVEIKTPICPAHHYIRKPVNNSSEKLQHPCCGQGELTFTKPVHPSSNPSCKCPLPQHPGKKGGYNPRSLCANITAHRAPALSDRFLGFFSSCQCPSVDSCLYIQTHRRHKRDHLILFLFFL